MVQKIDMEENSVLDKRGRGNELSMCHVLSQCEDFAQEQSALQHLVHSYGHLVEFSPKGHPEVAGEGVEYDWGVSKKAYRRRVDHSTNPEKAERHVREALATVTLEITRKTARRARMYMLAYSTQDCSASFAMIEKFTKVCKCHRSMLDQDTSYIEGLLKSIQKRDKLSSDLAAMQEVVAQEAREKRRRTEIGVAA